MTKKRLDGWFAVEIFMLLAFIAVLIYPLFGIIKQAVIMPDGSFTFEQFSKFFTNSYHFDTLKNSFRITIFVTILTLVIGIPFAYFYAFYRLKGAKILFVVSILCCMSAPFIGAYAWVQLRGNNGIITQFIARIIGHKPPSIYGFRGIVLVLALQLYPLVFMLVSGALKNVDSSLLEAAQNMGVGGVRRFFKMIIPLCIQHDRW